MICGRVSYRAINRTLFRNFALVADKPRRITKKEKIGAELRVLYEKLDVLSKAYYSGDSAASDADFDKLSRRCIEIEELYPDLIDNSRSPSRNIGFRVIQENSHISTHSRPVLSLDSTTDRLGVESFVKKMLKHSCSEFCCEPKFDGISLRLTYNDGILVGAASRGDGHVGEDVTSNCVMVSTIPNKLKRPDSAEIIGELYFLKSSLSEYNKTCSSDGNATYSSSRHAASGLIRSKTPSNIPPGLEFIAYDMRSQNASQVTSQTEMLDCLASLGFKTPQLIELCRSADELMQFHAKAEIIRHSLEFDMDGLVYKANNLELRNAIGSGMKSPKWALAHKFAPQSAVSVVRDIVVQVGRTGIFTPVAVFDPVKLGGVNISRASLFNETNINKLKLNINSQIRVVRTADVIPHVSECVSTSGEYIDFRLPETCPCCGSKSWRHTSSVGSIIVKCDAGYQCSDQALERFAYFVSKSGVDISGLSLGRIKQLMDGGFVRYPSDLFSLFDMNSSIVTSSSGSRLVDLDGWGPKLISDVKFKVNQVRQKGDSVAVLSGLGIPGVGRALSIAIIKKHGNLELWWKTVLQAINDGNVDVTVKDKSDGLGENVLEFARQDINARIVNSLITQIHFSK